MVIYSPFNGLGTISKQLQREKSLFTAWLSSPFNGLGTISKQSQREKSLFTAWLSTVPLMA